MTNILKGILWCIPILLKWRAENVNLQQIEDKTFDSDKWMAFALTDIRWLNWKTNFGSSQIFLYWCSVQGLNVVKGMCPQICYKKRFILFMLHVAVNTQCCMYAFSWWTKLKFPKLWNWPAVEGLHSHKVAFAMEWHFHNDLVIIQ